MSSPSEFPYQTAVDRVGVYPTNQALPKLSVVPVLPAAGRPMLAPVPVVKIPPGFDFQIPAKKDRKSFGIGEDDFVAMREARDATLCAPKLLYPAIQVNIRGGRFPPPDEDGRRFLRLPLTLPEEVS